MIFLFGFSFTFELDRRIEENVDEKKTEDMVQFLDF